MARIVETDEWKTFSKDYSDLTVEVTKRLFNSKLNIGK